MENDTPASKQHLWVELRFVPVIVTPNEEGDITIEVEDHSLKIADEEALYGCWTCDTPLTAESFKTECMID